MSVTDITEYYVLKISSMWYKLLWQGQDKIKRRFMECLQPNDGLGIPNIMNKHIAIIINRFQELGQGDMQPWKGLFTHWFGINLSFLAPSLYTINAYVHTLKIPICFQYTKTVILKYRNHPKIWNYKATRRKYIELLLMDEYKHNIEKMYPHDFWPNIWPITNQIKNTTNRLVIFKYLQGILPTADYLIKYKIVKKIKICTICKTSNTLLHIFTDCILYRNERYQIKQQIKSILPNINIDVKLIRTFYNDTVPTPYIKAVVEILIEFVIKMWKKHLQM